MAVYKVYSHPSISAHHHPPPLRHPQYKPTKRRKQTALYRGLATCIFMQEINTATDICIQILKRVIPINNIFKNPKPTSQKTSFVYYKGQYVNAVYVNNRCLMQAPHETHKDAVGNLQSFFQ